MLEVIENCCSKNYLDMLFFAAQNSKEWHFKYPLGKKFEDKHLKMDVIENAPVNEVIAGMAMGLLIQIYDKRSDLFHPEVSYCGISIKDKHRLDNSHKDHEDRKDYIKILGLLNSDWGPQDGGLFLHGDEAMPMVPTNFVVFDPRIQHCASEITTNKKRLGIDFTVKRK